MFIYFFPFFAERNIGIIVIYRRKSRFSYHSRSETKLIFEAISRYIQDSKSHEVEVCRKVCQTWPFYGTFAI